MAKRLPRPADAQRVRLELGPDELRAVEDAAHLLRLSVAAFARVAILDAASHPDRLADWQALAARLAAGTPAAPPKRQGRPPKKPAP